MPLASAGEHVETTVEGSSGEADAIQCPVCGHQVLRSNWTLHEVRCARGTRQCEHCGLQLHESELDAHWRTECPSTPVECVYCELPIQRGGLEDHVRRCGARTERCKKCSQLVRLVDRIEHETWACSEVRSKNEKSGDAVAPPVGTYGRVDACARGRERTMTTATTSTVPPALPGQQRNQSRKRLAWQPWFLPAATVLIAIVVHGLRPRERGPSP
ncbi:hypothetical protein CCYA_CCYA18G4453 [Cyanidiococcus yangmingshanensis]|nr:hypothetical protein CCYA_CCYA18G4453 [Cyanidiococcus yangmingshanensis]